MNNNQTATAVAAVEPVVLNTEERVEVNLNFYKRLLDEVYATFASAHFSEIKESFEKQVSFASSMPQLVEVVNDFIKDREFIDMVKSEKNVYSSTKG